jgi:hypothetical protein
MQHLKQRASYIFANPKREPTSWTIGYWAKMLSRSMIEKGGNLDDISKLAAPKRKNSSHPFFCDETAPSDKGLSRGRIQVMSIC